jgi:hypothetical protein
MQHSDFQGHSFRGCRVNCLLFDGGSHVLLRSGAATIMRRALSRLRESVHDLSVRHWNAGGGNDQIRKAKFGGLIANGIKNDFSFCALY